ncbi:hypothetical protein QCA50_004566 [Cerrena zonata]|uniref:BSD domain-containing protein n=1 Tax=Cerrena zonata TaxID=2478898 RepID=A0AAW0GLX0_9APHY
MALRDNDDTYDITSPNAQTGNQEVQQSLNEEVNQVVGQLSRFWGGFRKQSQAAFEIAKKDLGQVVSQAQTELTKLTTEGSAAASSSGEGSREPATTPEEIPSEISNEKEAEPPASDDTSASSSSSGHARTASQNLFTRLQASLPPNLMSTVQSQLPEALKQPGSIDFTQLRTTLTSEFQRVQGITRVQAEEYVHKSESLFREAGEFLKEAVKVIPPEEGGSVAPAGTLWDGTDIWMLPEAGSSYKDKGKEKERHSSSSGRPSVDGLRAVATRAEALLKQLRHDPEVIRVDPLADERASQLYEAWKKNKVVSKEGGMAGVEWQNDIQTALDDPVDGDALKTTFSTLVPSHISEEEFWTRYFFRVHQVEQEEERRKALIQGTTEKEDDFSWEDDEDEATSPTTTTQVVPQQLAIEPGTADLAASLSTLKANAERPDANLLAEPQDSRRQSSEDSYDVVSSQVSNNGETKIEQAAKTKEADEDDSDWE